MSEELSSAPLGDEVETVQETEAPEAEESDDSVVEPEDVDLDDNEGEPEGESESEPEAEEVEYDFGGGQKMKFPASASAKEVFETAQQAFKGVEANFTQKFQEVADSRKQLEAQQDIVTKLTNLNGEALEQYSVGSALKNEIARLEQSITPQLWQSQPDVARQRSDLISRKQAQFQQTVSSLSQTEQAMSQTTQAEIAQRQEYGKQEVERRIPGFNANHAQSLVSYAKAQGIPEQDAEQWASSPIVTEMAFKAMQFDALQQKASKAKASSKKPAPAKAVKPSTTTGGGGKTVRNLSAMSMEEYAKHMNAKEAKRRAR